MKYFIFDLQRFATSEIEADKSVTIDGVTFTAKENAVLNLDDNEKVSGIASGKVVATLENNPAVQITFDGTEPFNFSCAAEDDALAVSIQNRSIKFTAGEISCASENFSATGKVSVTGFIAKVLPCDITFDIPDTGLNITPGDETIITAPEAVDVTLTFSEDIATILENLKPLIAPLLNVDEDTANKIFDVLYKLVTSPTTAQIEGTVAWNQDEKKLIINKDSNLALNILDYNLNMTAKNGNVDGMSFFSQLTQGEPAFGAKFSPSTDANAELDLKLYKSGSQISDGLINIAAGSIDFDILNGKSSAEKNTLVTFTQNDTVIQFKFNDAATVTYSADKDGISRFTPGTDDGGVQISIIQDGTDVFGGTLNITGGSITFDSSEQKFSFTQGTKISLSIGDGAQEIDFEITGDDASFTVTTDGKNNFTITPDTDDGSIKTTLKQNGQTVFENNLSVNGSMIFNPTTQMITLTSGTILSLDFNNYTLTATADGNASSKILLTTDGLSITPQTDDKGKLKLTLPGTSSGSLSADIEILSGGFIFGSGGALSVTGGTELQIKFSDDYIINFKADNTAGGKISLGTDGITFAPGSDDGGLQLTVTRGEDTRSASLDVTGSVTYKLDGSISLTKGTVVKNVFDDGNILTITANTDAGGTINFNPQTGLNITPSKPKALTVSLQTGDLEVVNITSIVGSINYSGGIVTASNGTKARISYYFGWKSDLYTKGGTSSLQFTADRTVYTANEGATFAVDYLDGTTTEIQNGSYADVYGETIEDYVELVSEGTTLKSNDAEVVFTLETAGDYNLNGVDITTSEDNTQVVIAGDYDIVQFAADAGITVSATEDKSFRFGVSDDGTITVTTTDSGDFGVSSGSITFDDGKISIAAGTTISFTTGEQVMTFTAPAEISMPVKTEEDIYYLTIDEATLNLSVTQSDQKVFSGNLEIDGVFSWRPSTGTFGLTGANSSHGNDSNTSLQLTTDSGLGIKLATNDTTVVFVPTFADGKFEFNFPNENKHEMLFTVSRGGQTTFENQITIDGTVGFDLDAQELSLTKGTVVTLVGENENTLEITALADAGGQLTLTSEGIRFAPNSGDGQLELNFVSTGRKANIDVTGAVVFGKDGKISLEKDTEVTFTWPDDGTVLKLNSTGSTGSIGLDEKGIKITSEDENLTIDLTLATGDQTRLSGIKGTIYYNAGTVSFDENSTITATTTLGGEPILMTLETIGGTGHLDFASNGVIYSADTGAMRITWKKDDLESTFTVNSGSVQIGHGLFQISEGTDLATDLKDFVPALYFTTSEAGTYTINKQTIETTAENISMTATDYYMTFKTSDDAVKYDGMNFAGAGNVSLTTDGVVLGSGVVADGFGIDKSFILAEAGNVTADARIFELTEDVPTGLTVTGAQDGFIFSRVNTEESEFRFDDPDLSNIGKIFTEQFFLTNDDSYRIQSDLLGLQKIIGVSAPSTLHAAASFGEDDSYSIFDIVTDSEGTFNIGEKDYSISGDDEVAVKSRFFDGLASVTAVNDLNGTISGDFTAHEVSINGSASAVQVFGDENISITADDNGFEISGLDKDASLKVAATDTYIVNNTTINANGGDYIMGLDNGAALYGVNNDTIITGTEGNDTIQNTGTNVTIQALGGDDSISNSGDNASIDAGEGSNQIKLSGSDEVIVLKGQTSVEEFNTGFGDGSDTIYIHTENDPAGVEFLEDGLTFGNSTASLTLSDVNTTAKVNLFHENRDMLNKGVFIAPGDWYSVEDSDLTVDAGEEVYFVGTAAETKAGVDFSGITGDLNLTLDTAYIDSEEYVEGTTTWINGVYSIVGGAGNTTITGSKLDDTIITGAGNTTINAAAGDDLISLSGGSALITYSEGDGNDTIYGFDSDSTLSPDTTYKTQVSGNDLIVTIGESKITLIDAANLTLPNIESSNPIVQVVEAILKRTAAGYPVIAGLVFNPEEITGPEPTNYSEKEDWTITSADGLELYGVHYTPENSNDKWVVLVHGYGCMYESMNPFATFYLANNYNVLMIDQRAAGKSEGTWLTMGVAESQDVALWTQEIANRYPDSKITLHGVSMGAATAILAAARSDVVNVTSIVEDCGYSDVMKTFDTIVSSHPELAVLGISSEIIPLIDPVAESLTGYYLHDAAPIDSIASVKLPTLFISGDDDGVAPVSMLHELYDASGAEVKEKFIVEGAGHAQAGLNDPVGYSNSVFRFLSEANGEGWETSNSKENISLRGTKYNDTLTNGGDEVTVNGEAGDDYISNTADNVSLFGGYGNDTIYNHGDFITIDGGDGDDSISNNSEGVVFVWSGGNDTIDGFKEDSVFSIGSDFSSQVSGDDVIVTVGENKIVLTGASSLDNLDIVGAAGVTLENTTSNSLVSGTDDSDSITNYGSNSTIQALAGMDTISNTSDYSIINGGDGSDFISNYSPQGVLLADNVSISAGKGNDTIRNEHAYNVTLDGGDGNDKIIVVTGDHTTIRGGAGNDTILGETLEGSDNSTWAMGGYSNIDGGDGDDYIDPSSSDSASIRGGEGNDTIINQGDDSTLNGGAGDDIISLHGASLENNVIEYAEGDGNDSIFGFNETTKLSLSSGAEFSSQVSGDDVIVSVGSNEITIAGGANLSTLNITNEETKPLNISNTTRNTLITGTGLADTIQNSGANVSVKSLSGDDSITSSGANSSINAGAGNDTITNSGENSTLIGEHGDDKISNTADDVSISGGYGNDSIENSGSNVTISGGSGYNYTSNTGDNVLINFGGGLDTIAGFSENSTLSVSSADYETLEGLRNILVSSGDDIAVLQNAFLLDDSINVNGTTHEVEGKEIYLVDGGDEVLIGRSNVSIISGSGDDKISLASGANNDVIQYAEGSGNDTIWGVNETTRLSISGDYSSIKVGDDVFVTVGSNTIKLVDASDVFATSFEDGEKILLTEKGEYSIDGKIFELTKNVSTGVTLTGMKNGFTTAITESDGKIFIDEFIADGDDSYTAKIDGTGLQTVSGINAGTEITTGATLDGEEEENQIYIVTEDAGSYTFNDMDFTANTANAVIRLRPQAMAFDSSDEIVYDGKIFTGSGFVTVSSNIVAMGAGVVADGFQDGESFILMQRGAVTVDGKTFELTENVKQNMTVGVEDDGYTLSHEITQKEITKNNMPSDYLGKIYSENVIVEGDDAYSLQANSFGLKKVSGISNGATINGGDTSVDGDSNDKYAQGGQYFYVDTDTEGTFTIGEKNYSISGDSNVEIKATILPDESYASGFANLDGTVRGSFAGDEFSVNGKKIILVEGDEDFYVVGGSSGTKLYDVSDGATLASLGGFREVHTDTEGVFWLAAEPVPFGVTVTGDDNVTFGFNAAGDLMSADNLEGSIRFSKGTGGELSINGIGIHTKNTAFSSIGAYDDSLYIHDIERGTISAGEKVWLEMTGETMTLNGNEMTLTGDAEIWIRDKEIVGLAENASLQVSRGGTYTVNETNLGAKPGSVIIGLEDDAYVYDANNPLVTKNTSTADLEKIFEPENTTEISSGADVTLDGGNLAVIKNISERVDITAGDDTIVSRGQNVNISLTPETNTWLFPLEGKMTLEGYDDTTGTGFGTNYKNIFNAVEGGSIDFNNGILALGSAQVDVGENSALMNFFNRSGKLQKVGFASQSDSLDVNNRTEDLILVAKENSTILGGYGNDTILASEGSFVDGGAGSNLIRSDGATVAFNGRTTVEGEVDTLYIANADPGVDFKAGGLTFYDNTVGKSLTLSGVHSTEKLNLYYASSGITGSHVFIADDEWYNVSDGAADYYVGATAKKNHGIDFSGVSEALDVTLNTDYAADTTFWINNIHSIKGGSASTKITGSDLNDTILAGTGETTIDAGAGNDKLFGNTNSENSATFIYTAGDGRDSIENFNFTSDAQDVTADKVQLDDNSGVTDVMLRGSDVMLKVDDADGFLMIEDAKGKSFRLNDDIIAKVDTNVEFDGFTNSYVGIGERATLTVGKNLGNVEVWLSDDSLEYHGKMYDGKFAVLDASQSDGSNILAGNDQNNLIIGGFGSDSLWGGYTSSDDTLVGGAGQNTFFYGSGNGRDKIQNAHDGDIISLEDITLDQISDANITAGGVILNFQDGGSLTVDNTADVTYQLADGSKYFANHSTLEWQDK